MSEKFRQHLVALIKRETNAALAAQGLDLFGETPEYFAKLMRGDHARHGGIAKESGVKAP